MDAPAFRAALSRVGMTPTTFARYARLSRSTINRWLAGESRVDPVAVRLIEALERLAAVGQLASPPEIERRPGRPKKIA